MTLTCEFTGNQLNFDTSPQRIVSLSSGFTEALFELGLSSKVVGVSEYCPRYCDCDKLPRAGWYLNADFQVIAELQPDLILMTSGIQLRFAKLLASQGLPVYVLPLPTSVGGIYENLVRLGGLVGATEQARELVFQMEHRLHSIRNNAPSFPSLYAEAWFGVHGRMIGGLSFIQDILWYSGSQPLFMDCSWSYERLDLIQVEKLQPQIFVGFHEPEHHVDFIQQSMERGWEKAFKPKVILSTVEKGKNIIHDGPSLVDTVAWLSEQIHSA